MKIEKNTAFVLMPFNDDFNKIYEDLIKPALEDAGYDVKRADSLLNQKNILHDIINSIADSSLIVADLTTMNPNVFYEVGISHSLNKPTVLIAQTMDDIPFDLRSYKILIYSTRYDKALELRDNLTKIGNGLISDEIKFSNPVNDFLMKEQINQLCETEKIPEEKKEDEEEAGFFDLLIMGEDSIERMTRAVESFSESTSKIGPKLEEHGNQLNILNQQKNPGDNKRIFKVVQESAHDIIAYAVELEEKIPDFETSINELEIFTFKIVSLYSISGNEYKGKLNEFLTVAETLLRGSGSALVLTRAFRDTIFSFKHISKDMNKAIRKAVTALDKIIFSLEKTEAFCGKIITIINEKTK